ncbi:hypothetical protein BV372_08080 [Nostoc sp. T09]|uniref:hypothetical protein n=1 Tax=Nostoc sp. T09 TaxID=1932621 RepID=UPI000A3AAB1D|nr:hypothetical protein [Nostoc sp. T09]OUL36366.1 hypothetical protein BV372_08080 [Nostoc sp. T09]
MSSEQLSLFTIAPAQVIKAVQDPYWDEIVLSPGQVEESGQISLLYDDSQEPPDPDDYPTHQEYESAWNEWEKKFPQLVEQATAMSADSTLKVGDLVKLSPEWMNKCAAVTEGKYKKDYQFKSEDDLICRVLWVETTKGDISVDRNGYGLFVPAGNFTSVEQGDTVNPFNSSLINEYRQKDLAESVLPSLFTEESVRAQDTQISPIPRKHPELDAVTCAPEHFNPDFQEKFAPEHTHWTEEYWTKRGNKKHYYYRYCWMVGRKKHRVHIGSVTSPIAQARREEIDQAIAIGKSPPEIKQLIKTWSSQQWK